MIWNENKKIHTVIIEKNMKTKINHHIIIQIKIHQVIIIIAILTTITLIKLILTIKKKIILELLLDPLV